MLRRALFAGFLSLVGVLPVNAALKTCSVTATCCSHSTSCGQNEGCSCSYTCTATTSSCSCDCVAQGATALDAAYRESGPAENPIALSGHIGLSFADTAAYLRRVGKAMHEASGWVVTVAPELVDDLPLYQTNSMSWSGELGVVASQVASDYGAQIVVNEATYTITFVSTPGLP